MTLGMIQGQNTKSKTHQRNKIGKWESIEVKSIFYVKDTVKTMQRQINRLGESICKTHMMENLYAKCIKNS